MPVFLFLLGLIFGSFANVLISRLPKEKSILGRSRCPKCSKAIKSYDNIPILSYLLLGGKCRNCKKRISLLYPVVEISSAILFVLVYYFFSISTNFGIINTVTLWNSFLFYFTLPYLLFVSLILLVIFVIDLKEMMIPDSLSFVLFIVAISLLALFNRDIFWPHLFAGFVSALFLLVLNLVTKGRGMGLGDVKLALFVGVFLGAESVTWLFGAFIIGSVVGIILVILKEAKFGREIPFGPFLIVSFFITMLIEKGVFLSLLGL